MSSFVLYFCASYVRVGRSLLPLLRRPCFQFVQFVVSPLVCVYVCQQEKLLALVWNPPTQLGGAPAVEQVWLNVDRIITLFRSSGCSGLTVSHTLVCYYLTDVFPSVRMQVFRALQNILHHYPADSDTPLKIISITPRTTAEISNNYSVCKHKKHL